MSSNYPTALDSYLTAVDGITVVDASDRNNVQAAIQNVEKYGTYIFNVRTFGGAKGDNSTDDTTAIQNTINAAAAVTFGKAVVYFPPGIYLCSGTLTVASPSMIWQGSGGRGTGGTLATQLNYSGTGARFIDARNTVAFQMRDICVFPTNTGFTGVAVDISGSTGSDSEIRNCTIQFPSTFGAGSTGVSWDSGQSHRMVATTIIRGAVQLQLGNAANCNHCQVEGSRFDIKTTGTVAIQGKINGLLLTGSLVELTSTASVTGTLVNLQATSAGVVIDQLNVLDPGASSTFTAVAFTGSGFTMTGSVIGGVSGTTGVSIGNSSSGIAIVGNDFVGGSTALAMGTSITRLKYEGNASTATADTSGSGVSGVSAISVTASPFTYTNADGTPEMVYISGGTITTTVKNGVTIFGAVTNVSVWLDPGESVVVTYTGGAPTMNKDRK